MIKVNLALKKRAAAVETREKSAALTLTKIDASILKEPQFRKVVLAIIVAVMAGYLLDGFEADQLRVLDQQIQKAGAENARAKRELAKTAGFENLKKQLDGDEQMIRTKLDTIHALIEGRQTPPKILRALSNLIPKDVWVSDFDLSQDELTLKGSSIGFDPITDFMKSLGESDYFSDLKLVNSQKAKDQNGQDVAEFEIKAKRK